MLTMTVQPEPQQNPMPDKFETLDWSARLSLELIRQHTKTDDTIGISDEMLKIYRQAAVEAAELYTGQILAGKKSVTEAVEQPTKVIWTKLYYKHKLRYPVADTGFAFLYGGSGGGSIRIPVQAGQSTIKIPIVTGALDMTNCCDPCAISKFNNGMLLTYQAGYACADAVPAGIVLGCMQFISWILEHPGDELLTMRNRMDARGGQGVYGSNNIALVSGAIETWKMYDPEAI